MINLKSLFKCAILAGVIIASPAMADKQATSLVNLDHLDHLYELRKLNDGTEAGFIHIYSEYPDYEWVKDPLEGTSCVDDVARAAMVYLEHYRTNNDDESLDKLKTLVNFMLATHNENGYFNNFIYPDNTINTTYKTSVAEANWWTWRGVWSLAEIYPVIKEVDASLAQEMEKVMFSTIDVIYKDFNFERSVSTEQGVEVADWLPNQASDQSSVLLLALDRAYKINPKPEIERMMRSLAEGIMVMQINDVESEMYGALLSWKNLWHGYGNSQAYALLEAGMTLQDRDLVKAAFIELDHFHPYLLEEEHLNWFSVKKEGDRFEFIEKHQFAQIAYAVRPIIYSNIRAYQISRDKRYIEQAVEFAMWFFKQNPAAAEMYDRNSGRGYDGIDSEEKHNRNAGAESTVETLLSIQMLESEPAAKALLDEKLSIN